MLHTVYYTEQQGPSGVDQDTSHEAMFVRHREEQVLDDPVGR